MIKLLLPFVVDSANIRRLFGLRKYLGKNLGIQKYSDTLLLFKIIHKICANKGFCYFSILIIKSK